MAKKSGFHVVCCNVSWETEGSCSFCWFFLSHLQCVLRPGDAIFLAFFDFLLFHL